LGHSNQKSDSNRQGQARATGDSHGKGKEARESRKESVGKAPEIQGNPHYPSETTTEIQESLDRGNLPTKEGHGTQRKVMEPLPHGLVEVV